MFSTFGHMFAPRHQQTAREMARVCRCGRVIATATWTPEGTVGDVFRMSAAYMPPPPDFASPPILWGREDHVRELFADVAAGFEFERHVNWIEWDSLESFADFFMDRFGPMVTPRAMLGALFAEMREQVVDVWRGANDHPALTCHAPDRIYEPGGPPRSSVTYIGPTPNRNSR